MQIPAMFRPAYEQLQQIKIEQTPESEVAARVAPTGAGQAQSVEFFDSKLPYFNLPNFNFPNRGPSKGEEFARMSKIADTLAKLENAPPPRNIAEAAKLEQTKANLRSMLKQYAESQNRYAEVMYRTYQWEAAYFEYTKGLDLVPAGEAQLRAELHIGAGRANASKRDKKPENLSKAVEHFQQAQHALSLAETQPGSKKRHLVGLREEVRDDLEKAQKALANAELDQIQKLGASASEGPLISPRKPID